MINKKSVYNCHFKTKVDNLKINTIQTFNIQLFANGLLKTKSPKSVDNYLADLSALWKFSIKHKITTNNPVILVDKPKYNNTRGYPLDFKESKRLFKTIINFKEPLYKQIFTFLLHGRKMNEVLSLTWDMIVLEKKTYGIGF